MNKIKAFFNNKVVQIVAWILLAISTLVLILGGVSAGDIAKVPTFVVGIVDAKVPTFVVGIVDAIALFIVFIKKMLQARDTDKK